MQRRDFLKSVGFMGLAAAASLGEAGCPRSLASQQVSTGHDGDDPVRANTFSICAVDPATGEAGVAVASKCLSVGAHVCYAEPGVGAVATQATINPDYGPAGLALLRKGISAAEVVRRLTDQDVTVTPDEARFIDLYRSDQMTDEGIDFFRDKQRKQIVWLTRRIRQLGVVDRDGNAATHNGARIFDWSGSATSKGFCCQGNLLADEKVVADMAAAFEAQRGKGCDLVTSLLAALQAGDAAGGDKRGKQAAAVLVVRDRGHWSGGDRRCDVRVDDHDEPVAELARILKKVGFVK